MARYSTSKSSSDSSSDESRDLVNLHSTSEEEEEVVAEAPIVAIEEEDGSDIGDGNADNFPAILLSLDFEEESEGSDSNGRNIDNFLFVPPGFSSMLRYKKPRIPPFPPIEIVSDNESSEDTRSEASSSSGNGRDSGVEQDKVDFRCS